MLHAMIMAGGGGTRFWPRSRQPRPKQFLTFTGDRTLLQAGAATASTPQVPPERTWVITGEPHRDEAPRQLPAAAGRPHRRRAVSAATPPPCIGLGAALIARARPRRRHARHAGRPRHRAGAGVPPGRPRRRAARRRASRTPSSPSASRRRYPATGYGYIHRGAAGRPAAGRAASSASQAFREKPAADVAEQFVASGEYFWNSGIFVWKAATILGRAEAAQAGPARRRRAHRRRLGHAAARRGAPRASTPRLEKISIDYAVMEHATEVLVRAGPVPVGRRRQLAGPGAAAPAGRRRQHRAGARTSASTRANCVDRRRRRAS